jgi:nitrite reductase/ring-hydroxylating ferredoxin subunit
MPHPDRTFSDGSLSVQKCPAYTWRIQVADGSFKPLIDQPAEQIKTIATKVETESAFPREFKAYVKGLAESNQHRLGSIS